MTQIPPLARRPDSRLSNLIERGGEKQDYTFHHLTKGQLRRSAARDAVGRKSANQVHAEHQSPIQRFGLRIAAGLATLTCAGLFALLALVSLPASLRTLDPIIIVAWLAQTFIQLVALSILAFQNDQQARHAEIAAEMDHERSVRIETMLTALSRQADVQVVTHDTGGNSHYDHRTGG